MLDIQKFFEVPAVRRKKFAVGVRRQMLGEVADRCTGVAGQFACYIARGGDDSDAGLRLAAL
jgi:hypothetical protein